MRLVFIDLETGGLDHTRHPITQIAAIAVDAALNEIGSFEAKVGFDVSQADPEALAVSSYSPEVWEREARSPALVCNQLSAFFKRFADVQMTSRAGNPYYVAQLCGYNSAAFDGPFLQCFYRQLDQFMPAGYRVLDVMQRALWHFHERPSVAQPVDFKLVNVCKALGVRPFDAHDALADCRATVALYKALVQAQ